MKDQYISVLGETVVKLETIYGMKNIVDGTRVSDMSMRDIVQYYNDVIRAQSKEALTALNAKAGRELAILSYVSQRMTYFNKKRLDFSHYPNMKTVANVLIGFTNYKKISERTIRNINKIISLLVDIDEKYINYRNGLSYRYLRIFVIHVMFGNYCNASIIADFILHQFIIKEDLR